MLVADSPRTPSLNVPAMKDVEFMMSVHKFYNQITIHRKNWIFLLSQLLPQYQMILLFANGILRFENYYNIKPVSTSFTWVNHINPKWNCNCFTKLKYCLVFDMYKNSGLSLYQIPSKYLIVKLFPNFWQFQLKIHI